MNACGGRLTIVSNQRHCRRTLGRTQTSQGLDVLDNGRAFSFGEGLESVGQASQLGVILQFVAGGIAGVCWSATISIGFIVSCVTFQRSTEPQVTGSTPVGRIGGFPRSIAVSSINTGT